MDKTVDTLEGLPEHVHQFYEQGSDGKFHLQDISALKNALKHTKTERDEARARAKQVADWEKLGKTPTEIQEMLAAAEAKAAEEAKKAGDFDGILAQHKSKWEKDLNTVAGERDLWRNNFINSQKQTGLLSALTAGEATPEGIELLPSILSSRVQIDVQDGKVTTRILGADGNAMAGGGADGTATFADLIKEAKTKYPSLFKGTGQSGSGASNGKGGGGAGGSTKKRSEMTIPERTAYIREHGQAEYLKLPA